LLDQAIRLYRKNFLKFIGIIALVQVPLTIFQLVTSLVAFGDFFAEFENLNGRPPSDPFALFGPSYFIGIGVSLLVGIVGLILIQGVATAALTRAVAGSYLGESVGIIGSYRKISQTWLPLVIALLLALVLTIALIIWSMIPCVGWLTGLGLLAFFWAVIVPLIAPIVVLERQTAFGSIRRAWDLTRRRFWWVLGFIFILFLFSQLLITGPVALVSFLFQFVLGSPFDVSSSQIILQSVIQSIVQLIFSLIYLPLQLTAITLLYFDLRIRTEGFDLTLLSENIEGVQDELVELAARAPQPEQGKLVTMAEMGYFALIELGAMVLYFVIVAIFGALAFAMIAANGGPTGF
jgi:hypothetical protein